MVGAWVVFFSWVTIACATSAFERPAPGDSAIPTILGIPRWVALGIGLPWLSANLFIAWFALRFMKDTPLPADGAPDSPDPEPIAES